MALFAKNKPSKRVEFEGSWVELQYLSKGVKDETISRLTSLYKGMDRSTLEKLRAEGNEQEVPASMFDAVGKIQEIDYYKLSHAIKAWSEDVAITEEAVKELDESVFNEILKVVNEMNELTTGEQKN